MRYRQLVTLAGVVLLGSVAPGAGAETVSGEHGGALIGAVVGTLIAGPVGLVLGGAGGALAGLNHDLAEPSSPTLPAGQAGRDWGPLSPSLGLTLTFRTDSDRVEPHLRDQVQALAGLLQAFPGLTVVLEGYADRRGSEGHNLALSRRRAQAVQDLLAQAGAGPGRLRTRAYGEARSHAADGDPEGQDFERRVVVRLLPAESGR